MIDALFTKSGSGQAVKPVAKLDVDINGVRSGPLQHHWKQLLLLPKQTLDKFQLNAGQLKEDVVINADFDLHSLPSGQCLQIGRIVVRLTFHCEPCGKLKDIISPRKLLHLRGYHSQIVETGQINIGDSVTILPQQLEPLPYSLADRIKWYLERYPEPILVRDLISNIGFSSSYCRAVPNSVKHRDDIDKSLILYQSRRR